MMISSAGESPALTVRHFGESGQSGDDGEMMVISSILLSMWHLIARTDDTDIKYQVDFPLKSSQPLFEAKFHNYLQLLF